MSEFDDNTMDSERWLVCGEEDDCRCPKCQKRIDDEGEDGLYGNVWGQP